MAIKQFAILDRQNAPKVFMYSIMTLIYEYQVLLLILLKLLKNASIELGNCTKMFCLKKYGSCIQRMEKKLLEKFKDTEKS